MNRFQRTKILLGDEAFGKLQKAHVAVFGLGGVGSHAAESLARSGVGELTIVDFDKVNPTNINRQNIALDSTVGMPKSQAMADRIKLIHKKALTALRAAVDEPILPRASRVT